MFFFFFFQAEDGIRDVAVTGVQTCALPISCGCGRCGTRCPRRGRTVRWSSGRRRTHASRFLHSGPSILRACEFRATTFFLPIPRPSSPRSEEHTSELQSRLHLVCRLLLEKKKSKPTSHPPG